MPPSSATRSPAWSTTRSSSPTRGPGRTTTNAGEWSGFRRGELAAELGAPVAAGLVLVGAFAALTATAGREALAGAVSELVPAHRVAALQADLAALDAGQNFVVSMATT